MGLRDARAVEKPSREQIQASIEKRVLLAFDPGMTTGWAWFSKPNNRNGYLSGELEGGDNAAVVVWFSLEMAKAASEIDGAMPDTIICESFQYRPKLDKAVLTPVEVIGAVKVWCALNHVRLVFQTPAQRMWWTDERLKEMGLYKPGHPHANDAMRHLLIYMNVLPPKPEGG